MRPRFGEALGALRYGEYRRFATSLLLTSLGVQLLQTAVFWQLYELTGSALLLGLTGLARAAPHMVLSLLGGVIADRTNRVLLVQAGQLANAALVVMLAVLTITDLVEVWHLYVVTFLNGAFTAVTQPARTAIIPSLVPPRSLVPAVALSATLQQSAQILGPVLAGLALASAGVGATYLVNGGAYAAAMIVIVGIRARSAPPERELSPWRSFVEGMAFVRGRRVIIWLLLLDFAQTVLGSYRALLPIVAANLGVGAAGYGFLSAAPGVGSLFGSTFMLSLGDMRYKGLYTAGGVLGYCAALLLLAVSPWYLMAVFAAGLLGAGNAVQVIPRNSAILAIAPDRLRGRVEAFRSMLAGGGPPIGFTLSGAVAAVVGAPVALGAGAIACSLVVAAVVLRSQELRDPALGSVEQEEQPPPLDAMPEGRAPP